MEEKSRAIFTLLTLHPAKQHRFSILSFPLEIKFPARMKRNELMAKVTKRTSCLFVFLNNRNKSTFLRTRGETCSELVRGKVRYEYKTTCPTRCKKHVSLENLPIVEIVSHETTTQQLARREIATFVVWSNKIKFSFREACRYDTILALDRYSRFRWPFPSRLPIFLHFWCRSEWVINRLATIEALLDYFRSNCEINTFVAYIWVTLSSWRKIRF